MSPRIISHRGKVDLSSLENDLVGIQEAIDLGVDMVEFDVRKTSDDVLVCYHDQTINDVFISDIKFKDLKILNQSACELESVINICKYKVGVNVEIKEAGFEERVVDLVVSNFSYNDIFITSFHPKVIRKIKTLNSKLTAGLLIGDSFSYNTFYKVIKEAVSMKDFFYSKADFISPYYKLYEIGLMRKFENLGIPMQLWTVNDLVLLKDLINRDIHSIVTDVSSKIL